MKKALAAGLALLMILSAAGFATAASPEISASVTRDDKYGAAILSLSAEEFEKAGFCLGDSCDVSFGNGYVLEDVPFYNGYYVKSEAPVIVAAPGKPIVVITLNNTGIWDRAGLSDDESVTIRLNQAGGFSAVQEVLGNEYSHEYSDYPGSVEFCNFRELSGGSLKKGLLFRGASPVNNSRNRAPYTDMLIREAGIARIIDLADSEEDIAGYMAEESFDSPYAKSLCESGSIVTLDMNSYYHTEEYARKLASGLKTLIESPEPEGPVYIHCNEGKDRTGFVCMLIEALAGATYDEMLADYMKTYENYYSVTKNGTPEKYDAVAGFSFDSFMLFLHGTDDASVLKEADYVQDAAGYLTAGGMTPEEVEQLRLLITAD